jgi:CO/xanthine dehydrogenase FAD-binding subunit
MTAYHQPTSVAAALTHLRDDPSLTVVAGATDVYPAWTGDVAKGGARGHRGVLDVSKLSALRGIEDRGDHWWLGALTTWSDIARADHLPPLFDGLKAAAREIGGIQIQNRGTIAGNIVTASPAGDSIPCLLALDADVECVGGTEFRVPLERFITGYRKTILDGELVTGIRVPKANGHGHFLKLGARRYLVISIAMVAATFELEASPTTDISGDPISFRHPREGGDPSTHQPRIVRSARIAVGACSAVAQRLPALERALIGRRLDPAIVTAEHLAHLAPIDDVRASGDYRRAAARQLVADLLEHVAKSHA